MRNIVALALFTFAWPLTAPLSAWSQTVPAENVPSRGENNAPLSDPKTLTFYGSFRVHSTLTTVDEAVDGRSET